MKVEIKDLEFQLKITKTIEDNEILRIRTDAGGNECFRVEMRGKTLLRLNNDGTLIIHTSDYQGRPYTYARHSSHDGEDMYKLVPNERN